MSKMVQDYILTDIIGEGQFGKVWKAHHMRTKKLFAIKAISLRKVNSVAKFREFLSSEIDALEKVKNCSNIVKYYEKLQTQNNMYLIFEFCTNGTLEEKLNRKRKLSETEAMLYFGQLLNAFKALNQNNIMHRDLKPGNILFDQYGELKLADFGFCKKLRGKYEMTKSIVGSPIYMAPELLQGKYYGSKADIWSLGVVLYEMVFGRCPYEENSIQKLLILIKGKPLVFIGTVSRKLKDLLERMLKINPNERIAWNELFHLQKISNNSRSFTSDGTKHLPKYNKSSVNQYRFSTDTSGIKKYSYLNSGNTQGYNNSYLPIKSNKVEYNRLNQFEKYLNTSREQKNYLNYSSKNHYNSFVDKSKTKGGDHERHPSRGNGEITASDVVKNNREPQSCKRLSMDKDAVPLTNNAPVNLNANKKTEDHSTSDTFRRNRKIYPPIRSHLTPPAPGVTMHAHSNNNKNGKEGVIQAASNNIRKIPYIPEDSNKHTKGNSNKSPRNKTPDNSKNAANLRSKLLNTMKNEQKEMRKGNRVELLELVNKELKEAGIEGMPVNELELVWEVCNLKTTNECHQIMQNRYRYNYIMNLVMDVTALQFSDELFRIHCILLLFKKARRFMLTAKIKSSYADMITLRKDLLDPRTFLDTIKKESKQFDDVFNCFLRDLSDVEPEAKEKKMEDYLEDIKRPFEHQEDKFKKVINLLLVWLKTADIFEDDKMRFALMNRLFDSIYIDGFLMKVTNSMEKQNIYLTWFESLGGSQLEQFFEIKQKLFHPNLIHSK